MSVVFGKLPNIRNCKFILTDVLGLHIGKRYLEQVTYLGKLRFGKKFYRTCILKIQQFQNSVLKNVLYRFLV
jgi:hypothetical protein